MIGPRRKFFINKSLDKFKKEAVDKNNSLPFRINPHPLPVRCNLD